MGRRLHRRSPSRRGENEAAIFNGSVSENQFEGILPTSGDYRLRVYLMRSAARRNETANYRLEMIVTDAADQAGSENQMPGDALVPGTEYHAVGDIPCALGAGRPEGSCPFGVVR